MDTIDHAAQEAGRHIVPYIWQIDGVYEISGVNIMLKRHLLLISTYVKPLDINTLVNSAIFQRSKNNIEYVLQRMTSTH